MRPERRPHGDAGCYRGASRGCARPGCRSLLRASPDTAVSRV